MPSPLRTPLFDAHVAAGARIVEFAGYDMPVQYGGVIAESKAVRQGAGMFDVSHMARLTLRGAGVVAFLEHATTNDIAGLAPGQGHYSLLPNEKGGTVDDIIVYKISGTEFKMVVNAGNHAKDVAHLDRLNTFGVEIIDSTGETAMIAVQGPGAVAIVSGLSPEGARLSALPFFGTLDATVGGVACFAARSGYTGEDGFELVCAAADAPKLWDALVGAGVMPCGLGARDVLRVEAGLPLYGHELADDLSPIAAGLGWVIVKDRAFLGSEAIGRARSEGPPAKLQGVRLAGKRLPVPGMEVMVEGRLVGKVTSGIYSPLLECGCAFAFVEAGLKQGTACSLDMRGKLEPGEIVNKRFFRRSG